MNPFSWRHRNRDLTLILTVFLLGLGFMLLTGTLAIGLSPQWAVKASMDSMLDPNAEYIASKGTRVIEPILPAILTPPTWQAGYLTPLAAAAIANGSGANATATSKPQITSTLAALQTLTPVASPQMTGTGTSQVTPTSPIIIFVPASSTPKPKSATPKPTAIFTQISTATAPPPITPTRTKSLTPTSTFTPTITATWINSVTPTATETPTETWTPTITATPTVTATIDPLNWGPSDGYFISPPDGTVLTFPLSQPINDHSDAGYDFVYYERATGTKNIQMDAVQIEVSPDGTAGSWTTVFYWGDNLPDANSNLDYTALGFSTEGDNDDITWPAFIGDSGIGIDIYSLGLTGDYYYLRITAPVGGNGDGIDIDAIEIYP